MSTLLRELETLRSATVSFLAAIDNVMAAASTQLFTQPVVIHPECVTPYVPDGYDTVLGYLAKHHPDVLECFDYMDPAATQRDGWWLSHRCTSKMYVDAPPAMRERGIERVRAYPVQLLQARWG